MTSPFQMGFNEWRFCWAANLNWKHCTMIVWLWRRSISLSIKMVTSAQAQLENTVPPCPQGLCISRWLILTGGCNFKQFSSQIFHFKHLSTKFFSVQHLKVKLFRADFLRSDFTVDKFFIEQSIRETPLDNLRDDLGLYLKVLRSSMIELINQVG